jgi:hypothetical protein
MVRHPRKTAPKVRDGKVLRKNRHARTPSYWNTPQASLVIDRERPGRGFKHLLRKKHITEFACIVPEWDKLADGLDAIVLAAGGDADGWYDNGVVGICAWEKQIVQEYTTEHVRQHSDLLDQLQVEREKIKRGAVLCKFTESTARAYQLLHILLHELGHHFDRMTAGTISGQSPRGEPFAEEWAYEYERLVWDRYVEAFGLDW